MLTRDWVTKIVVAKIMVAVLHFNSLIYPHQIWTYYKGMLGYGACLRERMEIVNICV